MRGSSVENLILIFLIVVEATEKLRKNIYFSTENFAEQKVTLGFR